MSDLTRMRLCGVDCETTGVDVDRDRIVSAALVCWGGGAPTLSRRWLSNLDGAEIPDEAARIHGITTEMAHSQGLPAAVVLEEIVTTLAWVADQGGPLVVMNAPFDLTLLDREAARHGVVPLWDRCTPYVLDPYVLDKHVSKRRGPRNLASLCSYWCVRIDGAHNAEADAKAACGVLWKIAARHRWLARMPLADLHNKQAVWALAQRQGLRDYYARTAGLEHKAAVLDEQAYGWPRIPAGASR